MQAIRSLILGAAVSFGTYLLWLDAVAMDSGWVRAQNWRDIVGGSFGVPYLLPRRGVEVSLFVSDGIVARDNTSLGRLTILSAIRSVEATTAPLS